MLCCATPSQDSIRLRLKELPDGKEKLTLILKMISGSNHYQQNIIDAQQGMPLAQKLNDSFSMAKLYMAIGEGEYFAGNYDEAASNIFKGIHILEQHPTSKELGYALNSIAKLYRKTRDLDKAEHYYNQALALFEQVNDSIGVQMIWNESGVVYEYKKDYNEAIRRYKISGEYAIARKDSGGLSYVYNFLAGVYVLQNKFADAEQNMNACIAIREKMKDTFSLALGYSDFGALYLAEKKYEEANKYYQYSNAIAQKLSYTELLGNNYFQMAEIAKQQGDFQTAYNYYLKGSTIKDSVFSINKMQQIQELNTKYQTEKKEQQLQLQSLAINKKNFIIIFIVSIATLSVLLLYSYYRRKRLKQEAEMNAAIIKQQDLATKAVIEAEEKERQRIAQDLHDGVGQMMSAVKLNLSSFQSELSLQDGALQHKLNNIYSLVDDSCKEVRSVSHNMMPNALIKSGLGIAIREFLQKIDTKVLEVSLYIDGLNENLPSDMETMVYRIVQECVNNVVKHAVANRLDISIVRDEHLTITIEDNGKGFDMQAMKGKEGIGLQNIKTRVSYLKGNIEYDSSPGRGTVVLIEIPI